MPTKTDQVHDLLRDRILSGELRPGTRLSMDALARELGVSKIPVREAVGRLEAHGLVTTRAHVGPTVAEVDPQQLRGAYLARGALDPLIARLAAQDATEAGVAELAAIQQSMRDALAVDDRVALADTNARFHSQLAGMSGYAILAEISASLLMAVRRYRVVDPLTIDNWATVVAEHESLLAAVTARDGDAAEAAGRLHATSQAGHDHALDA